MALLKRKFCLSVLLVLIICPGQQRVHAAEKDPITVFASLAPVAFVVGEIGGDLVDVHTLIPQGRDPHTFSPTPRQAVALSQAEIYFTVAMTFEE
ncbi:MAG: zinc ABC transporter substrate-binding protein, partial [Proteobacteria bacterium]|nr:zinc ABC transporter substrate-binding protein [Pseudomonadota bacterium]